MKRWLTKPLGDVCEFVRGISFKPTDLVGAGSANSLACFRTKNVQLALEADDLIHIPRSFVKTDRQLVQEGDALISTANSNNLVGKCCFVPRLDYPATLGGFIAGVRSNPKQMRPRFLYYWLASPPIQERLRRLARQTTNISNLPLTDVAKELAPVPPLVDQERIVKLLDEADELRMLRVQADRRTADLIPALFQEMFGDPDDNLRGWARCPVSSFVEELHGGRSVNPAGADEAAGRFRVLKISAVTWGEFNPEESKPVPAMYEPPESHFVRAGDLLFSRANTTELVAATSYVFDTPPNLLLPDKLWRFVWMQPQVVEPLFVWWLFQAPSVRRKLGQRATGTGGSMKNISKPKVMSLEVPLPPLPLQKEFAARVSEIRAVQAEQADSRRRLDDLFQSLLHRAFNGEL